jgi:hypothetical protein
MKDIQGILLPNTAHSNQMLEAPASRKQHQKTKPTMVTDYNKYKISVNKFNQMLEYWSIHRKSVT